MSTTDAIAVRIAPDAGDDLADATTQLRETLLELDVEAVDVPRGEAPADAKAGAALEWGTLLVTAGPAVIEAVVRTIQNWLNARRGGSVTIQIGEDSITLQGATEADQARLIEAWIDSHSA